MNDIGISTRKPDPVARARALGPAIAAVVDEIERTQGVTLISPLFNRGPGWDICDHQTSFDLILSRLLKARSTSKG